MRYNVKLSNVEFGGIKIGGLEVQSDVAVGELYRMKNLAKEVIKELPEVIQEVKVVADLMDKFEEENEDNFLVTQIERLIRERQLHVAKNMISKVSDDDLDKIVVVRR